MNKRCSYLLLIILVGFFSKSYGQETVIFAVRDSQELKMDIYAGKKDVKQPETIIYVFGGGFFAGSREDSISVDYCRKMQERGFTTVAIDYRLGMKGKKLGGLAFVKAMEESIGMAVEDLTSAVVYLINNGSRWGIDASRIVTTGSSAGAITVLETDYSHAIGKAWTRELPEDFRFAGVMSYSGAIFSHEGKVKYTNHAPAPTMLYHGTADKTVEYKQIEFGKLGFYGCNPLAEIFKKNGYPVRVRRFDGLFHEVCEFGNRYVDDAVWFIENWVRKGEKWTCDETFKDVNYVREGVWSADMNDLYK